MHVYVDMYTYVYGHNSCGYIGQVVCRCVSVPVFGKYSLREETTQSYWP